MDYDRVPNIAEAGFSEGLPAARRTLVAVLIPVLLLATVALARTSGLVTRPASLLGPGAAVTMTPAELQTTAAEAIERAVARGGAGVTFEIVQRSTVHVRAGGETLETVDPLDPAKTVAVETVPAGTYLERGALTEAGFHSEIRRGPDDPAAKIDWNASPMELAALVRDGKTYRNDGAGWYPTDRPPGIGLDPATAALLPTLLRGLTEARDAGVGQDDPFADIAPTRRLAGASRVADIPGIIAVDLADVTAIDEPADLAFDDTGRLIGLRIVARNTNLDPYDLLVETVITFAYPEKAPPLPAPEPVYVESTPEPES